MRNILILAFAAVMLAACSNPNEKMNKCENDSWDKVFPKSEKVSHEKVTFVNRFGITLVADLYKPLAEPFIVTRGNKQLYIVPNATHCDLYDGGEGNYIPFEYLAQFYKENLK